MVMQLYVETSLTYQDVAISPDTTETSLTHHYTTEPPAQILKKESREYAEQMNADSVASLDPLLKTPDRDQRRSKEWVRPELKDERVPHLIILQHGYMGDPKDMKLLRNTLTALLLDSTSHGDHIQVHA
jgi:hypothetical protein